MIAPTQAKAEMHSACRADRHRRRCPAGCAFAGFKADLGAGVLVARSGAGDPGQVALNNTSFSRNVAGSAGPALYLRAGTTARLSAVAAPNGADAGTAGQSSGVGPNTVANQPADMPSIAVDAQPSASDELTPQATVYSAGARAVGLANRGTTPAQPLDTAPEVQGDGRQFAAIREVRAALMLRHRRSQRCDVGPSA